MVHTERFFFYYNRKEYLLKQRQGTISQSLQFDKTLHLIMNLHFWVWGSFQCCESQWQDSVGDHFVSKQVW